MLKYLANRPNFFFWEETNPRVVLPDDLMVLNKKMSDFFSFKKCSFLLFYRLWGQKPFFSHETFISFSSDHKKSNYGFIHIKKVAVNFEKNGHFTPKTPSGVKCPFFDG